MSDSFPMRRVHLDFHTSAHIKNVAQNFDSTNFINKLKKAKVNAITCFSRGHHGYLYYKSKKFPERIHPELENNNLLQDQLNACKKAGIKTSIYIPIQWDKYTAEEHPEWLMLDENGKPYGNGPYEPGFYNNLCVNTPYRDFLFKQTKEILNKFDVEGLFFDIVQELECSCKYCRSGMLSNDLNPELEKDRKKYAHQVMVNFKKEMTDFIRKYNKDCTIFYNKGHIGPEDFDAKDAYTHYEVEALPGGGWGYMYFPVAARYVRKLKENFIGMTGKFHTFWGDFHSFKNKEAMEYECFQMLALNGGCSIGDQMLPSGKLSDQVYDLIGSVYTQVEKKEKWCKDTTPVTEIAIINSEEFLETKIGKIPPSLVGATRILQEESYQFDIIDTNMEFKDYKLLILADDVILNNNLRKKLDNYLKKGGKIIASYHSGLNMEKEKFLLDMGINYRGDSKFLTDFILPENKIGDGLPETEHVMYKRGVSIENQEAKVLTSTVKPYFNREWNHYCSHKHTPSSGKIGHPAIIRKNNIIYFTHPIFKQFNEKAPPWCKKFIDNALKILLEKKLVDHDGPNSLETTLNYQKSSDSYILHLLHYIPEKKSEEIEIVENKIPLYNLTVKLNLNYKIESVKMVPQEKELEFEYKNSKIEITIPKIDGHQIIQLSNTKK